MITTKISHPPLFFFSSISPSAVPRFFVFGGTSLNFVPHERQKS
ncbi:MAG: hypothetical protein ACXACC_05460 [Promethearchaeota archaeon]